MYSDDQKKIIDNVKPVASFLRNKSFLHNYDLPWEMQEQEVFETCHELFPKLSKRLYNQFLKRRDLIVAGSISCCNTLFGKIEVKYTNTVGDVSTIAHEIGHADQRSNMLIPTTKLVTMSELYPRLIQKQLDELTGDDSFGRNFFIDISRDKKEFVNFFHNPDIGFASNPKRFRHFIGSILTIPVSQAISNGRYNLDKVADWCDENTFSCLNGLGVTHKKVLASVEQYLNEKQFV